MAEYFPGVDRGEFIHLVGVGNSRVRELWWLLDFRASRSLYRGDAWLDTPPVERAMEAPLLPALRRLGDYATSITHPREHGILGRGVRQAMHDEAQFLNFIGLFHDQTRRQLEAGRLSKILRDSDTLHRQYKDRDKDRVADVDFLTALRAAHVYHHGQWQPYWAEIAFARRMAEWGYTVESIPRDWSLQQATVDYMIAGDLFEVKYLRATDPALQQERMEHAADQMQATARRSTTRNGRTHCRKHLICCYQLALEEEDDFLNRLVRIPKVRQTFDHILVARFIAHTGDWPVLDTIYKVQRAGDWYRAEPYHGSR